MLAIFLEYLCIFMNVFESQIGLRYFRVQEWCQWSVMKALLLCIHFLNYFLKITTTFLCSCNLLFDICQVSIINPVNMYISFTRKCFVLLKRLLFYLIIFHVFITLGKTLLYYVVKGDFAVKKSLSYYVVKHTLDQTALFC